MERTKERSAAPQREGFGWRPRVLALAVAVAALAVIAIQNAQNVRVEILFAEFSAPLIVMLLATAALGAVIGYVAPILRRGRRAEHGEPRD